MHAGHSLSRVGKNTLYLRGGFDSRSNYGDAYFFDTVGSCCALRCTFALLT